MKLQLLPFFLLFIFACMALAMTPARGLRTRDENPSPVPLCDKCKPLAAAGKPYPTCRERRCTKCVPECCKEEQDRCCCLHRDACECPKPPEPISGR